MSKLYESDEAHLACILVEVTKIVRSVIDNTNAFSSARRQVVNFDRHVPREVVIEEKAGGIKCAVLDVETARNLITKDRQPLEGLGGVRHTVDLEKILRDDFSTCDFNEIEGILDCVLRGIAVSYCKDGIV